MRRRTYGGGYYWYITRKFWEVGYCAMTGDGKFHLDMDKFDKIAGKNVCSSVDDVVNDLITRKEGIASDNNGEGKPGFVWIGYPLNDTEIKELPSEYEKYKSSFASGFVLVVPNEVVTQITLSTSANMGSLNTTSSTEPGSDYTIIGMVNYSNPTIICKKA